jgi:FAD binding domain/Berberine and berberine like
MAPITVSDEVSQAFSGALLAPGDPGYDEARQVHNGMIDKRPGLIARCSNTADVRDMVDLGRDAGVEVSVRGGGHNVAGNAVTDGGLMIDLAPMRGIHVDPAARTVRVQGGVTWNEYNRATAAFGLATTGGVISTTGVAGLTLGGGLGWLMGTYGLAIDNLLSAEVVTADGRIRTASEQEDPDLFWALRGGGGNFGAVTSFEFQAYPLESVTGGILAHPLAAAPDVIDYFHTTTKGVSDELTMFCGLVHAPDGSGTKLCALPLCHCGHPDAAEAELAPIRAFGPPALDMVAEMPYPVVNTLLDDGFPKGTFNYWKSAFLTEITSATAEVLVEAFEAAPSIMSGILIENFHGAVTRVDPQATAFPHREPGYNLLIAAQWPDPADSDANMSWLHDTYEALEPFTAPRAYVNYMGADDADRVPQAYGPNYERLAQIKGRYDPENLFHLNQNIAPAA